jgi:hypothetical protein
MSVALIFLDGVGIGRDDPDINPFARYRSEFLSIFSVDYEIVKFDGLVIPTDATLGVYGIPQSATGQTAIFTGVNAAKVVNAHINGFPTPTLREILLKESIFLKLSRMGKRVTFANAYSRHYFELRGRWLSATTYAVLSAGVPFRWYDKELVEGRAIPADLTGDFLSKFYSDVKKITPEEAGRILYRLLRENDFVMYEFPFTDSAGHARDFDMAVEFIDRIDRFLNSALSLLKGGEDIIILTSDHGNIEDLSIKTHTMNMVPTIIWGNEKDRFSEKICRLTDITPAIVEYMGQF